MLKVYICNVAYNTKYIYFMCCTTYICISIIYLTKEMAKRKVLHRIPEVLKQKGKSGYWLAQESGITYNSINRYVNDKVEPSLTNLSRIAEVLGVPGKDLINF